MKSFVKKTGVAMAVAVIAAFGGAPAARALEPLMHQDEHMAPTGRGHGQKDHSGEVSRQAGHNARVSTNGITYHSGPIMTGIVNVYFIWYGDWSTNASATALLQNLAAGFNGTPYYGINKTYFNGAKVAVSGQSQFKGAVYDSYSRGKNLADADILAIVTASYPKFSANPDPNGVYFVLTSADVNETSGFCTQYCGWHTFDVIAGTNVKYSFVGNPARCLSACAAQATSPNGNPGADAMASIIAHELSETVTDPELNAWFDTRGYENADKCAWRFGNVATAANGSKYNVTFGGINWLLQQNWVNARGGSCVLK